MIFQDLEKRAAGFNWSSKSIKLPNSAEIITQLTNPEQTHTIVQLRAESENVGFCKNVGVPRIIPMFAAMSFIEGEWSGDPISIPQESKHVETKAEAKPLEVYDAVAV